ncbi:MAG: hypothetical protein ACRDQA_12580 [Nocardioidaceae bacterium]
MSEIPDGPESGPDEREEPDGPTSTGSAEVDATVSRLPELDQLPLDDHVAAYDDIHRTLSGLLEGEADAGSSERG